jgi:hypothetical protein
MLKSFVQEERDGVARPVKAKSSKTTLNLGVMCTSLVRGQLAENSLIHFEVLHFDSSGSRTW